MVAIQRNTARSLVAGVWVGRHSKAVIKPFISLTVPERKVYFHRDFSKWEEPYK
jgi:hypothetical protein